MGTREDIYPSVAKTAPYDKALPNQKHQQRWGWGTLLQTIAAYGCAPQKQSDRTGCHMPSSNTRRRTWISPGYLRRLISFQVSNEHLSSLGCWRKEDTPHLHSVSSAAVRGRAAGKQWKHYQGEREVYALNLCHPRVCEVNKHANEDDNHTNEWFKFFCILSPDGSLGGIMLQRVICFKALEICSHYFLEVLPDETPTSSVLDFLPQGSCQNFLSYL